MNDGKRKRSKGLVPRHMGALLCIDDGAAPAAGPAAAPPPEPTATSAPAATPAPSAAPAASPAPTGAPAASPAPTAAPAPAPAAAKVEGAPEAYAEFKLPEGVKLDAPTQGKFTEWAKANNLSQEAAQAAVDMHAQMQQQTLTDMQAAMTAQAEKWGVDSKADKEIGGAKFDENLAVAKRALDQFGTPELKTLLNDSGLGNHPEILRAFYRAGQAISQDGFVPGRSSAAPAADAQKLYAASGMNP